MSNQPESAVYDVGVYQLETVDPVQGGVGGLSNTPLLNLANRTTYLKAHIDALEAGTFVPPGIATLNNPTFTGTVIGPTVAAGDYSTKFATTAYVNRMNSDVAAVTGLTNANVTLTAAQYGCGTVTLAGALTGNINIIFPDKGRWFVENITSGAFSITCKTAAGTGVVISQGKNALIVGDAVNIVRANDYEAIGITGASTAATPADGDNSTLIATTAFVNALKSGILSLSVAGNSNVTLTAAQYGKGILKFTGLLTGNINIIVPNNGQWIISNATTGAFSLTVKTVAGTGIAVTQSYSNLLNADGTNVVQSQTDFNNVNLGGNSTATTQTSTDNSTRIATTAFVKALASLSTGGTGYARLPGGLILQWGGGTGAIGGGTTIGDGYFGSGSASLPLTFPTSCFGVVGVANIVSNGGRETVCNMGGNTTTVSCYVGSGQNGVTVSFQFLAFGY